MKELGWWRLLGLCVIVALFLFVMFGLPLPATAPQRPLLAGAEVPPQVRSVLERSCQDCHSYNTTWPWYARIAPLRWYVTRDVDKARRALNLSEWETYSSAEKHRLLTRMADLSRLHQMPPPAYIFGHREVVEHHAERVALEEWAKQEAGRLAGGAGSAP